MTVTIDDGPPCEISDRVKAMIRWLIKRADAINAMPQGSIEGHFKDECLTMSLREYEQLSKQKK